MSTPEFDFVTPIERRGTASLKWQRYEEQDILPMWVADMDFAAPPAVQKALRQAVERGVFGYGEIPSGLIDTFIAWCAEQYHWAIEAEWLVWLPGVVPGLHLAIEAELAPEAGLAVPQPVYPPIRQLGRLRARPLVSVPCEATDWTPYLTDATQALVLCHPHNPSGQVATRADLEQLAQLALERDLLVISDEIWADLLLDPQQRHLPFAALNPDAAARSITLMAPSKTFNIAGLSCAVAIIPDPERRARFRRQMRGMMPDMNYLGLLAAQAAWQEGAAWLAALKQQLNANLDQLEHWLQDYPEIGYTRPQATFVAWLDLRQLGLNEQDFLEGGVALSPGEAFGTDGYLRLNFGCPSAQLDAALQRMARVIQTRRGR